jgi:thioesterase domain-containing protein
MIKQVQRRGPYFLGGQSFGGLIAYEMASVLVAEGEEVAFVAMIDTFPWEMPNRSGAARLEILFGGRKLEDMMEELFQVS